MAPEKKTPPQRLREAVDYYSATASGPFTLKEATAAVCKMLISPPPSVEKYVGSLLHGSFLVFDNGDDSFVPKSSFFKGKKFLVKPTEEEIKGGFLIPGHRFMPFISPTILPSASRLILPDGSELTQQTLSRPLNDIRVYFSLFSGQELFAYMGLETEENYEALKEEGLLKIRAFNLDGLNGDTKLKVGDYLQFTVMDWQTGCFDVCRIKQPSIFKARRWCTDLEEVLTDIVFDLFGPLQPISEQLAQAFFYGYPALSEDPSLHLGGFVAQVEGIEIQILQDMPVFWYVDMDAELDLADNRYPDNSPTSPVDEMMDIYGIALDEDEVEAYMRDELYRGGNDLEAVITRMTDGRDIDAETRASMTEELGWFWQEVIASYDRTADELRGKFRAPLLDVLDEVNTFIRVQDRAGMMEFGEKPPEPMIRLGEVSSHVAQVLFLLNGNDLPDLPAMKDVVEYLPLQVRELIGEVERHFQMKRRSKFRVIEGKSEIFQLKVSLKNARPPIWRRLLVESHTTLYELHEIIQEAMGWENYHMHMFRIGNVEFGDVDCGDLDFEDETLMSLATLKRRDIHKWTYEYDFGDGWGHSIQLEKVLEPKASQHYPCCIKGVRQCPPEDVGGIFRYMYIVAAIADPDHPDHEEMSDMLGEDFDATAFDKEAANMRLRTL